MTGSACHGRPPDPLGDVWESNYAGFRSRGIPLVHQVAVSEPWRGAALRHC